MISHVEVLTPKTLAEAYQMLQNENGRLKVLAGGTDLMVLVNTGTEVRPAYMNIWRLNELRGIRDEGGELWIGALTTYTQMIKSALLQVHAPILIEASKQVGAVQIQNRGTIGGNIVNASPAGDTLPALSVFEAELEIGSTNGTRRVSFNKFYTGYRATVLQKDELLLGIRLPKTSSQHWQYFRKVGTRQAQAISKVVMAIWAERAKRDLQTVRISYGSVAPTVIRAPQTEAMLSGHLLAEDLIEAARQKVMQEVHPISDVRSTETYRRVISGNILGRALRILTKK